MTAITRYKLRKVLKYALVTALVAWVLTLFSGDRVDVLLAAWLLLGLWTGILEEFLFGRRFRSLAIPLQFLGKVLLVNMLTLALIAAAFFLDSDRMMLLAAEEPYRMGDFFLMRQFYQLMLRVVVVTSLAILVVQVEELMGRRMFLGFLLGRYERPKAEERIVMTMDLVGSTALADRMGDLQYYRFLNVTYSLMTDAVLRNEADIHKYVGDEVIFTWPMRVGVRYENCLDLHFDVAERIELHAEELQREFGVVPRYRTAVHGGRVISAQIGHIKRAIDLSGDVMNSVSRMLGLAKTMDADILVSAEVLERIPKATERFLIGPQHTVPVKGRRREVRVHTLNRLRKEA
ncbi:MAG: adenylate/guanylate cyclase domain-containing protein [Flavobacteriales bacterium]|nr:adenylate/guanylate cyclase domain-containing protein [Flavobacteriales bacterium]